MSNGFYTGMANTFWYPSLTNGTGITFSAPQLQLAINQYQQLVAQVDRNGQLQLANAAYWERLERERQEAHERAMREWEAERVRIRLEEDETERKALQLVGDVLTEEEFALFKRERYVFVTNENSGNEYKVRYNATVLQWRFHKAYVSICIVPDYGHHVPAMDAFLAKYLLCKYDEDTLLDIGHHSPCY